jgi:hypothetical protein
MFVYVVRASVVGSPVVGISPVVVVVGISFAVVSSVVVGISLVVVVDV